VSALVLQAGIDRARLAVIAVLDGQATVLLPFVQADISHPRTGVYRAEIAIVALQVLSVATVEYFLVLAEAEVTSGHGADVFGANLCVVALNVLVAATRNRFKLTEMVQTRIGGAAIAVVAVSLLHAAARPGGEELA